MQPILITNIHTIYGIGSNGNPLKKGLDMQHINQINNAYLLIENNIITSIGTMEHCPAIECHTIDAQNGSIMPTWCDSHTHIVYSASREDEYVARLAGANYEEIAKNGGGILNSAKKVQLDTEQSLYEQALQRLQSIIASGTGAIEIKSGYGLSLESELKLLRVIRSLKENSPILIKSTFLGAHAIPTMYKDNRNKYIDIIINEMLPRVSAEGLADYCDVFCDKGFFTVPETDKILKAAIQYGLPAKIHANELANSGGVQVGIANNAISVDHLEEIEEEEIKLLLQSSTIPTVLPTCSFFLGIKYAPARLMIDSGLGIAMATDCNPGSSPSGNIPLLMAIACNNMKVLPSEAFNAVTINGAYAMEINDSHGVVEIGKKANLLLTKPNITLDKMVYYFGENHIQHIFIDGSVCK